MPIFERGDIVAVPFPYVEHAVLESRPAVVVSRSLGLDNALLWVLMITSARNAGWPGDVAVSTVQETSGLRAPSVIRTAKIATVEGRVARKIGKLDADNLRRVDEALAAALGR